MQLRFSFSTTSTTKLETCFTWNFTVNERASRKCERIFFQPKDLWFINSRKHFSKAAEVSVKVDHTRSPSFQNFNTKIIILSTYSCPGPSIIYFWNIRSKMGRFNVLICPRIYLSVQVVIMGDLYQFSSGHCGVSNGGDPCKVLFVAKFEWLSLLKRFMLHMFRPLFVSSSQL